MPHGDDLVILHCLRALENARQRVVIARGNGVELVVVAARAANRHAHKRSAERVELLVNDVHLHLARVIFRQHFRANAKETGRHCPGVRGAGGFARLCGHEVTGNLLAHKCVIRQIAVEGVDDPVAVTKGINVCEIFIEPIAVGVARNVQPVSAPLLAVTRRSEQAVD